ncbi:zinc finger CCCH domain-containing protein 14-like [Pecten maximus]|uniref:zinc finger CCCH domain-containing protein 14-like n=1 Tax=Pecten maximus TaxID=6579 RepID=UPI0014586181|nr:zinc finger CCCH domain-containing protein 14-like [Pecten maximus]
MMDIGKDISKKIRSAIKAKLIELGAYVDDELPDYIMVMVANKKSQAQMTEDLGLFLSANTEQFTSWLNGLLNKLQTLGTDKQKSQELEKSETESMSQQHVAKKKKTPEKTDKSISEKTMVKDKNLPKVQKSIPVKTNKVVQEAKKVKGEEEYVPLLLDKSEIDEFNEEFKPEESKSNKKSSETPTAVTGQIKSPSSKVSPTSKTSPSTAASAEVKPTVKSPEDTTYIRSVMVKPSVTKRLGSVHSRIGQVPKAMAVPVKRSGTEPQRQVSPVKRKQPMSVVGNVKRKFTEFEEEEEYDPYNPAVGSVASVIRVTDRKSSVPAGLQANKSLLVKAVSAAEKSVSSKMQQILNERKMYSEKESATVQPIQRGNRSSSVPGDTHPHTGKNSGLVKSRSGTQKPVNREVAGQMGQVVGGVKSRVGARLVPHQSEAHMDMVSPMTVTLSSGMKPKANLQLMSQVTREKRMFKDLRYTIANDMEKVKKEPEVARVPPVMDSRRVQCVPIQDKAGEDSEEKEETSVNSDEEIYLTDTIGKGGMVSEEEVEELESNSDVSVEENIEGSDNITATDDIQQVPEEDIDDLDLVVEEVAYSAEPVERSQLDKRRFIQQRTEVESSSNTKFIVTLDGVDHDKYEIAMGKSDEDTEMVIQNIAQQSIDMVQQVTPTFSSYYKQKPITLPKVNLVEMKKPDNIVPAIGPISINLRDTDDEEEMEVDDDSPLKKAKMTERCRFWPACVNGNSCTYHHPTVPCKMFPQCKFGDRCLFIHPNCKFDAKCTRKDCPYTHASKRGTVATTVIQKIVPVAIPAPGPAPIRPAYMPSTPSSVTCKFYPNCKNMSCPFPHPTPCRFGMSCMKKSQCVFYHPALPTKDKLKWTASKTSDDRISERKFESSAVDKHMSSKIT